MLLTDVSGSMATFARFTMQLTFAMGTQFSRVRTFAFVDGLADVAQHGGVLREEEDREDIEATSDIF